MTEALIEISRSLTDVEMIPEGVAAAFGRSHRVAAEWRCILLLVQWCQGLRVGSL